MLSPWAKWLGLALPCLNTWSKMLVTLFYNCLPNGEAYECKIFQAGKKYNL